MPSTIYISVGHTAHSQYNTGIQRVTRSIARETLKVNPRSELLEWNIERGRYIVLDDNAREKRGKLEHSDRACSQLLRLSQVPLKVAALVEECRRRPLRTWRDYVMDMHRILDVDC